MFELEPWIRLGCFVGILLLMMWWEWRSPRRPQPQNRSQRWPRNLLLLVINTLILRWCFPLAAVGAALLASEQNWGLFNAWPVPTWLSLVLSLLILDLLIYLQHRLLHALPLLWRLHRVHHADVGFDVTTGLRFHPLEILLSMLVKLSAVILLGAPPLAVLLFEVLLNATAMFNHANINLPTRLDIVLRRILVTPDMHRVHHSVTPAETNSNFGFNLPWWDRLFGTYQAAPKAGHVGMTIGLTQFRTPAEQRLHQQLLQPFRRK
ncbi:sterol desaturase family protein [Oceanisphaera pacifica]|uniref:Sterol desaturase family protein n=1 Tax=Oceanisphaera pacifica TaxID=2818389 RepID=A0ABS3NDW9_9GAMM|nr:sterol desaturase family protein [Oceanisphaera pacifica]MBO1518725.1 sterol desaturase family protein [Oceanisphaera pacifica]